MQPFPNTIIIRHRRENLKKCSLRGLESREDFYFTTYPNPVIPDLTGYVRLSMEGEPLTEKDANKGILLLDGTWRYAEKMERSVDLPCRTLPSTITTSYPRRQDDCPDQARGLASVEALYVAYTILGRDVRGLLDHYYWQGDFLDANSFEQHN